MLGCQCELLLGFAVPCPIHRPAPLVREIRDQRRRELEQEIRVTEAKLAALRAELIKTLV